MAPDPEPGDSLIAVDLELGDPALPDAGRRTFDTGSAWSAYVLDNDDRAILMALPAARATPLVSARFDAAVTRVSVTCSPRLAVDGRCYNPVRYPLDQLLMLLRLAREGGALLHCALLDVGGVGVVCPGVSGAGKTTLARQLASCPDIHVLSDDRAVIRRQGGEYQAYGTPWPGEAGFAVNRGLRLGAIGFIHQSGAPATERITGRQALHRLMPTASLPWFDREAIPRAFDGLADLCGRLPAALLRVPPDPSAAAAVRALAAERG